MKYEILDGFAELTLKDQPMVTFTFNKRHEKHDFYASQVLDSAALGEIFVVPDYFEGDNFPVISASEVRQIADWIRDCIQPVQGTFQTVWVPNDRSLPF